MLAGEATLGLAGAGAITLAFDQIGDPLEHRPGPAAIPKPSATTCLWCRRQRIHRTARTPGTGWTSARSFTSPTDSLHPTATSRSGRPFLPRPGTVTYSPPPPPAKYPLDVTDIVTRAPGDVGPSRYQELSPGVWAPDPSAGYQAQPPWPAPQQPIVGRLRRPRGHGPTAEVRRSASIDVPVAPRLGTTAVTDDAAMSTNRDDLLDLSGLTAADHRGELVAVGAVAFGARPVEVALHGAHRHR